MSKKKSTRGFASLSKEQRQAVASKGGKTAHALGRAHVFTKDEAQSAGRKGGLASRNSKRKHTNKEGE